MAGLLLPQLQSVRLQGLGRQSNQEDRRWEVPKVTLISLGRGQRSLEGGGQGLRHVVKGLV